MYNTFKDNKCSWSCLNSSLYCEMGTCHMDTAPIAQFLLGHLPWRSTTSLASLSVANLPGSGLGLPPTLTLNTQNTPEGALKAVFHLFRGKERTFPALAVIQIHQGTHSRVSFSCMGSCASTTGLPPKSSGANMFDKEIKMIQTNV